MTHRLNWKQALCLLLGGLASIYVFAVPPWKVGNTPLPYSLQSPFAQYTYWMFPVGTTGSLVPQRDWLRILLFLGIISLLTAGAIFMTRTRERRD